MFFKGSAMMNGRICKDSIFPYIRNTVEHQRVSPWVRIEMQFLAAFFVRGVE